MSFLIGAILAGGKASRLGGINKALLQSNHSIPTLEHLSRQLRLAGVQNQAILANSPLPYIMYGIPILPDLHPGMGPLAGFESALLHARQIGAAGVCIVPCDLPALSHNELRGLCHAWTRHRTCVYAASAGNRGHYACTILPTDILPIISETILGKDRSLHQLHHRLHSIPVFFKRSAAFMNLNTPDDVKRWQAK